MADSTRLVGRAVQAEGVPSPHPVLEKVMLGRLVLLGALLAGLSALATGHSLGLYAVMGAAFLITIPYAVWLRNVETMRQSAENQFLLDTVIITGIIHFTGGIESDLCLLYPLVILAAGIVVSGNLAFRVALFAVLVYATLIVLELGDMLPFPPGSPVPAIHFQTAIQTLMLRILFFLFFAAATRFVSDRVLVQYRELRRLRGVGQLLFNEVSAPLLVYFPTTRRIVLGNEAAARLLGMDSEEIPDRLIDSLFDGAVPEPGDAPQPAPKIWRMRRGDGASFPALVETSTPKLPPAVTSAFIGEMDATGLTVMAFHDLGEMLDAEDDARLKTTAGVLAEFVHSVGNPVTALRAAGEVLGATAKLLANGGKVSVRDLALIETMCTVIGDEAKKLDDKVAYFLDLATSDPERLRELTDQATIWADKLALNPGAKPQPGRKAAAPSARGVPQFPAKIQHPTTV